MPERILPARRSGYGPLRAAEVRVLRGNYGPFSRCRSGELRARSSVVTPANAGVHIPEAGAYGSRLSPGRQRGDEREAFRNGSEKNARNSHAGTSLPRPASARAAPGSIRSDNIAATLTLRNVRALRLSLRPSVACDLCHNHFAGLSWTSRSISAKVLQNDTVRVGDSLAHKPGLWHQVVTFKAISWKRGAARKRNRCGRASAARLSAVTSCVDDHSVRG